MQKLFSAVLATLVLVAASEAGAQQIAMPLPGMATMPWPNVPGVNLPNTVIPGTAIPGMTMPTPGTTVPGMDLPSTGGMQAPQLPNMNLPTTSPSGMSLRQYMQYRFLQGLAGRTRSSGGATGYNPFFTPDMNAEPEQPKPPKTSPGKLSPEERKAAVRAQAEKQKAAARQRMEARKAQAAAEQQ